jgi:hypothetical protein
MALVAMWHCPHCGAPQAETARCWVCRRSSTTCSTCRHFRTSLAGELGWCALDRRRRPLTGLELRGCWEEGARAAAADDAEHPGPRPAKPSALPGTSSWRERTPARSFIPIGEVAGTAGGRPAGPDPVPPEPVAPPPAIADAIESWETRTSLFGEPDR